MIDLNCILLDIEVLDRVGAKVGRPEYEGIGAVGGDQGVIGSTDQHRRALASEEGLIPKSPIENRGAIFMCQRHPWRSKGVLLVRASDQDRQSGIARAAMTIASRVCEDIFTHAFVRQVAGLDRVYVTITTIRIQRECAELTCNRVAYVVAEAIYGAHAQGVARDGLGVIREHTMRGIHRDFSMWGCHVVPVRHRVWRCCAAVDNFCNYRRPLRRPRSL